jgi:hypothetical protein
MYFVLQICWLINRVCICGFVSLDFFGQVMLTGGSTLFVGTEVLYGLLHVVQLSSVLTSIVSWASR